MKKNLLFINQNQFGYHITYYKYCQYLNHDFNISLLCWDYSRDRFVMDGINVIYVSRGGNMLWRNLRFIIASIKMIRDNSFNFTFIKYFRGCSLIRVFCKGKSVFHMDIVTGSVSKNPVSRLLYNSSLTYESLFFKNVSVISEGLKQHLKIKKSALILPLGADPLLLKRKADHKIHLLYIGTLSNRNLDETVTGLGLFIKENPAADVHYTVIGTGWGNELERLSNKIKEYNLTEQIDLMGYIPHKELTQYFEKANVGVSYIPLKPWYDYQPATKTFEYLLSGMPVIATATYENKKVINNNNGIIINDNAHDFAAGIEFFIKKISDFDENIVRESVNNFQWKNIVSNLNNYLINI